MNIAFDPTKSNFVAGSSVNHWGHDKNNPDLTCEIIGRGRPSQIQALIKAVDDYYYNPFNLPTLANLNGKTNDDGLPRSNRSDGRENEIKVLKAMLSCGEYASLRVGTPHDNGGFTPRSCLQLAEICGLVAELTPDEIKRGAPLRPSKQFFRAYDRLEKAGFFTSTRRNVKEWVIRSGKKVLEYRARRSIKCISRHFLVSLGTMDYSRLEKFRKHCSGQINDRRALYAKANGDPADKKYAEKQLRATQEIKGVKTNPNTAKKSKPKPSLDKFKARYRVEKTRLQAALIKKGVSRRKDIIRIINEKLGTEAEYISARMSV